MRYRCSTKAAWIAVRLLRLLPVLPKLVVLPVVLPVALVVLCLQVRRWELPALV